MTTIRPTGRGAGAPQEPRVDAWNGRAQVPLTIAAVVFLAAFAWPILQPRLAVGWVRACYVADLASWAVFVVDYVVRVCLARRRLLYVRFHLLDLAVVVLPVFRPLALVRLLALAKAFNRQAAASFRGRTVAYTIVAVVLVVFFGALAALDAERGAPGANIETFGNALWWAVVTVTTVGYGDYYPVTVVGRVVAVVLMIAGVAVIGVVTATLASWFLGQVRSDDGSGDGSVDGAATADTGALAKEVGSLREEIAALRAELAAARPDVGGQ